MRGAIAQADKEAGRILTEMEASARGPTDAEAHPPPHWVEPPFPSDASCLRLQALHCVVMVLATLVTSALAQHASISRVYTQCLAARRRARPPPGFPGGPPRPL